MKERPQILATYLLTSWFRLDFLDNLFIPELLRMSKENRMLLKK